MPGIPRFNFGGRKIDPKYLSAWTKTAEPGATGAWLVVGIGNPGREYAKNRHNVGFMAVDELAVKHGLSFSKGRGKAEIATGKIGDVAVFLVKPQTYVNLSGESVGNIGGYYHVPPGRCLVVCDELDIPLGTLRLRGQGGAGGHNGLKSIIAHLKTQEFPRLRIGIGRPPAEAELGRSGELVTGHVLGDFSKAEREVIEPAIQKAVLAIETVLAEGISAAMNSMNEAPKTAPKVAGETSPKTSPGV